MTDTLTSAFAIDTQDLWRIYKTGTQEVAALREQIITQFKALSAEALEHQGKQAEATAQQRLQQTDALLTPVKETLEAFRKQLGEVERDRAATAADLRNQVIAVKQTGDELRKETTALVSALRQPQVRGNWGEQQLQRVVELAGMVEHCDFALQATTRNDAGSTIRPDLKVVLAGGKLVFVDSKVPLTAFLDAYDAAEEADRAHHLGRFVRHVQTHIDQLSKKDYFTAETATPEFVVLFMPSEALAAEAFSRFPSLHEYASERGVVVASPTSLIAMLKTVAYSWRQAALADSAREVFELGRTLYRRLGNLGSEFNKVGRALTTAVTAYNASVGSIESRVFPTARKLKDLNVVDTDLIQVIASEASVRPLTAPELVEDAESLPVMIGRARPAELDAAPGREPELEDLARDDLRARAPLQAETA